MIRIRVIYGGASLLSRDRVEQVQEIFRASFPELAGYADRIPALLRDPIAHGYRAVLVVAEGAAGRVDGFALVLHFAAERCVFLDFIAVRPGLRSGGVGGALYEATREFAVQSDARGLYLEVDPDDAERMPDPVKLAEAKRRMRFYEQYGVRVVEGTAYDTPIGDPPTRALLLFDGLGVTTKLGAEEARRAVGLILSTRFGHVVDPKYVRRVVDSFRDDPVRFRERRATKRPETKAEVTSTRLGAGYSIVYTPKHEIHHIAERGYFEKPIRAETIKDALGQSGLFTSVPARDYGEKPILAVHDMDLVYYLQTVCAKLKEGRPYYPDTFPIRRLDKRPKSVAVQAGYYCLDTGTPLYRNGYVAARASANCALTAADEILSGRRLAYAVCRPPGHHAGRRFFGGFCYFNNAAIAAQHLGAHAKVAVLDIDFHHGNGAQDIFYERDDVLTLSIHGNPDYAYPYFSGYANETGAGRGLGYNQNYPLAPQSGEEQYLPAIRRALEAVHKFRADVLIVALGYDILKGDPTGTLLIKPEFMRTLGRRIVDTGLPVLVVQEGGYNVRNIRKGCVEFFRGCVEA